MTGRMIEEIAEEINNKLFKYLYDYFFDLPNSANCDVEKDGYLIQVEVGYRYKIVRAFGRNDKDDWTTATRIKEYVQEFECLYNEAREQRMQEANERDADDRQELEYWKLQRL